MEYIFKNEASYCCCFCNHGIQSGEWDPCDLTVVGNFSKGKHKQQTQWFFCHMNCFKNTLHLEMQKHFVADQKDKYCDYECMDAEASCEKENTCLYTCYLCYKKIEVASIDPCAINLTVNFDKEEKSQYNQLFYLHARCFRNTLHAKIQQHFVLHLLEEDD